MSAEIEVVEEILTPNDSFAFRLERWKRLDGTESVYFNILDIFDGNEETLNTRELKALIADLQTLLDKWEGLLP